MFVCVSDCVPERSASGWIHTEAKVKSEKMKNAMTMKVNSKPENGRAIYTTTQHKASYCVIKHHHITNIMVIKKA